MFKVHRTSSSDSTEANREGDDSGDPSAKNIIVHGLSCNMCISWQSAFSGVHEVLVRM
jgi:hypothetical protein